MTSSSYLSSFTISDGLPVGSDRDQPMFPPVMGPEDKNLIAREVIPGNSEGSGGGRRGRSLRWMHRWAGDRGQLGGSL